MYEGGPSSSCMYVCRGACVSVCVCLSELEREREQARDADAEKGGPVQSSYGDYHYHNSCSQIII